MDLNYLFYRLQVERSMAEAATSEETRKIHANLAREYREKINAARKARGASGRWLDLETPVNQTMALAMTARELV